MPFQAGEGSIPRCKPLKYAYEKEIVMYAYFKRLHYFSTECVFAPNAYRGHVRAFLKDLEKIRSTTIIDIIHSGESVCVGEGVKLPQRGTCSKCGFVSSQLVCKVIRKANSIFFFFCFNRKCSNFLTRNSFQACTLLTGLNKGLPKIGIGKTSKTIKALSQCEKESSPFQPPILPDS